MQGSRAALAESITLVESTHPRKRAIGDRLLSLVVADARRRHAELGDAAAVLRVGISGSPGVGKSSFIETLGTRLVEREKRKLAVLTVDPSAHTSSTERVRAWRENRVASGGELRIHLRLCMLVCF
jgi:LAO/AO transport system kinase